MMLLHNLKNVFHILLIFQCLFFSIYLLSPRYRKRLSNLILAAFLLVLAFTELGGVFSNFLDLRLYLIARFPHIFYINFPFPYLAAPLIYFYVLSITQKNFKLKKVHLFHFIPFVLLTALIILRFHRHSPETLRQILKSGSAFSPVEGLVYNLLAYVQFITYAVISFSVLRSYRSRLKDVYSTIEQFNLAWLNFVLSGFIIVRSLEVADEALWVATKDTKAIILYYVAQIVFLGFLTLMFLKGLKQPEVFIGIEENNHRRKYEKALLSEEQKGQYAERIKRFMEMEKPYLDPLLSLGVLAREVAIPSHHLSQVLNTCFCKNFFDFINFYRIKESQRLLADPNNGRRTILEIAYQIGFNSKSVFNTAFKKQTGMTPSQFRKLRQS